MSQGQQLSARVAWGGGVLIRAHEQRVTLHSLQIVAFKNFPFAKLSRGRKLAGLLLEAFLLVVQNYPPFLPLFSFLSLLFVSYSSSFPCPLSGVSLVVLIGIAERTGGSDKGSTGPLTQWGRARGL